MAEKVKEDFLTVDPKIPGQNYVCLSFVSPEKILKEKEIFFMTKFLNYIVNDQEFIVQDIREKILNKEIATDYQTMSKLYGDWKYTRMIDLEEEFHILNEYKTTIRGLKVRGVYDTKREADVRAQTLTRKDKSFHTFIGQVGYWLPWDPECQNVPEQEYQESQLNELVKNYKDNLENRDVMYEQEKNNKIEKAKKEVLAKKQEENKENKENNENNNLIDPDDKDEAIKNIVELRNIVDESDKLYHDNLKAENESKLLQNEDINNFKVNSMITLEEDDPWINRKKEN
jgi:hypothetical protein